MSILIKGMAMPKTCKECPLSVVGYNEVTGDEKRLCLVIPTHFEKTVEKYPDCPLNEIDLVRCGECKYFQRDFYNMEIVCTYHRWAKVLTTSEQYCSHGERRAEEKKANCPLIEIPTPHGRLVEEHYPGELKAKQAEGLFILFRSADEDTDRLILEEEK